MFVIGQSLECWRPPLSAAVAQRDPAPLLARARRQLDAGALALDVNFGAQQRAGLADDLIWSAGILREALPGVPLFPDCGDLEALTAAVAATPGPAVANAVPLDGPPPPEVAALLAAIAASGAGAVFSPRAADRVDGAEVIVRAAEEARVLAHDAGVKGPLYLDCLAYPPALYPERCRRSLAWLRALREAGVAGIAPLVAVGNVGHGVADDSRDALAAIYVVLAIASGVETLLMRAEDSLLMSLVAVMESHCPPASNLERWALAVQARPAEAALTLPPPGAKARAVWDLLAKMQS